MADHTRVQEHIRLHDAHLAANLNDEACGEMRLLVDV
jgi:hypothetical protein